VRRREFITLLGGAAPTWPLVVRAQQGERMRRLGVLMNGKESDPVYRAYVAEFAQTLQRLGWREGQNLRMDLRWPAGDPERIGAYAAELVGMTPDVILCSSAAKPALALLGQGAVRGRRQPNADGKQLAAVLRIKALRRLHCCALVAWG
jgi:putative ABC transport system substrate-binding protein